jgi:hypothetical protein
VLVDGTSYAVVVLLPRHMESEFGVQLTRSAVRQRYGMPADQYAMIHYPVEKEVATIWLEDTVMIYL